MPQMGESITEGTLTKWLKQVGDHVERDQPLFEISTDKVDAEIPAPTSGTLTQILVQAGATVAVNSIVAVIGGSGSPAAAPGASASAPAIPAAAPTATPVTPAPTPATPPTSPAPTGARVKSSPLVRKIARENNLDLARVSGSGAGGRST